MLRRLNWFFAATLLTAGSIALPATALAEEDEKPTQEEVSHVPCVEGYVKCDDVVSTHHTGLLRLAARIECGVRLVGCIVDIFLE